MEIAEACLGILDLNDVEHSTVGDAEKRGISGGQLKRVNIGIEVASDPTLLFLDEPTSGRVCTLFFRTCRRQMPRAMTDSKVLPEKYA